MSLAIPWNDIVFLRPLWLLAILPVGLLWWRWRRIPASADTGWTGIVDPHLRPAVLLPTLAGRRDQRGLLLALVLGCLALAGPAVRHDAGEIAFRSAAARVLVLDLSPAMDAADWTPPRSTRARLKLLDLLQAMPDGQTALLVYGEESYLVAPPTTDSATIALLVPELSPAILPLAGDEPLQALTMAIDLLRRSGASRRDLVWITGRPHWPDAPAGLPDTTGIAISVLHAATDESAALRHFAAGSGGRYLRMSANDADVHSLAALLARQPAWHTAGARNRENARDLGPWLLLLILPIAAWSLRGYALLGMLCALPLLPAPAEATESPRTRADDRHAYRLFRDGRHEEAARAFRDARWQAAAWYRAGRYAEAASMLAGLADADAHYNRGNALARAGDLRGALGAYEEALVVRPFDPDSLHNRDLVRDLLRQASRPDERDQKAGLPPADARKPPSPSPASAPPPRVHEREADALAEQLLRRIPDDPAGLVQRKLALEHQRRLAHRGGAQR